MSEIAIQITDLCKKYQLGIISTGTLSRDIQSLWSKLCNKEDPNSKIYSKHKYNSQNQDYIWALQNINLEIAKGEILGIIGKNGAGKSTILKILSRITSPTSGIIKIKGRVSSLLEIGTGFHPDLTGKENIYLNGAILGMSRYEIKHSYNEIVEFSGVQKYIDTPVKRYSSGMRIRLAFSVAAHLNSDILLVDEVLAVGDADFREKCIKKMNRLSVAEDKTVIFVSHNLNIIKQLCKKCVYLKNGIIEKFGSTKNIIDYYLDDIKNSNDNKPVIKGNTDKYQIVDFNFDGEILHFRVKKNKDNLIEKNNLYIELTSVRDSSTVIFKNLGPLNHSGLTYKLKFKHNLITYGQYSLRIRLGDMGNTSFIFEPKSTFTIGENQIKNKQYIETELFENL